RREAERHARTEHEQHEENRVGERHARKRYGTEPSHHGIVHQLHEYLSCLRQDNGKRELQHPPVIPRTIEFFHFRLQLHAPAPPGARAGSAPPDDRIVSGGSPRSIADRKQLQQNSSRRSKRHTFRPDAAPKTSRKATGSKSGAKVLNFSGGANLIRDAAFPDMRRAHCNAAVRPSSLYSEPSADDRSEE